MNLLILCSSSDEAVLLEEQFDGAGDVESGGQPPTKAFRGDTVYFSIPDHLDNPTIKYAATITSITPRFRYRTKRFKWNYGWMLFWRDLRHPDFVEASFLPKDFRMKWGWCYLPLAPCLKTMEKIQAQLLLQDRVRHEEDHGYQVQGPWVPRPGETRHRP